MFNFIGWIVIGVGFGFIRAWKRTSESYARAMQTVEEIANSDRIARAQTIGQIKGLRIFALVVSSLIWGAVGAVIWLAATGLVLLLE